MKRLLWVLAFGTVLFLGIGGAGGPASSFPLGSLAWADSAAVGTFHDALVPYGDWVHSHEYGEVWSPRHVPIDWRPYTVGRWAMTDDGWAWASSEPWGWACYHYGRWFYDDTYGWCWYPGSTWAPAWVCWRYSDDWIGWAPLPPLVGWNDQFGLDLAGLDLDAAIPWFAFSFCDERDFLDDDLDRHIALAARNIGLMRDTRFFVNLHRENGRLVDDLPVEGRLARVLGHAVPHYRLNDVNSPGGRAFGENRLNVFRPNLREVGNRGIQFGPQGTVSPEMIRQQQQENQALQRQQEMRRQTLQRQQQTEMQNLPSGVSAEQMNSRHQSEMNAFQEQTNRENQLLGNWHQREQTINSAPSYSGGGRKYDFGGSSGGSSGGRGGGESFGGFSGGGGGGGSFGGGGRGGGEKRDR